MPEVEIPIPPSTNNLWRAVRTKNRKVRLIKSREYAGWLGPAVFLLRAGLPRFASPVRVRVTIRGGKGFPESRDCDNCLKAVLDALRHADRIGDDTVRFVPESAAAYIPPGRPDVPATCFVTVEEVGTRGYKAA